MAKNLILDLFFPKKCVGCGAVGAYFCQKCKKEIRIVPNQACLVCGKVAFAGLTHPRCRKNYTIDGSVAVFVFAGPIRQAIHNIKYKRNFDLIDEIINLFLDNFWKMDVDFPKRAILVPVPLHTKRLNWRGFNQSELIAKRLSDKFGLVTDSKLLTRFKNTKPQVELKGKERQKNVFNAFKVTDKTKAAGREFLLIDDMQTTGATLKNCAFALKRAGAKSVWGLTIARSGIKLS